MKYLILFCFLNMFYCNTSNTNSNEPATVTIKYYKGLLDASTAIIEVNGGSYTTVAKNSTKEINVDTGDKLDATWSITTITGTVNYSAHETAVDGLEWSL